MELDFDSRRYKFRSDFNILGKDKYSKIHQITNIPELRNFKALTEDLLHILRKRFPDCYYNIMKIQFILLEEIALSEKTIRYYKNEMKNNNLNQNEKKSLENQIYIFKLYRNKLKEIGDAIAWKLLGYNRNLIYLLSDHQETGFIEFEEIYSETKEFLRRSLENNEFAIINSITHCLRIGDIISKDQSGNIIISEVKSSKRSARGRLPKQKKTMNELIEFLNKKRTKVENTEAILLSMSFYPQNYFDKIRNLLSVVYNKGYGIINLNEFSFAEGINFDKDDDIVNKAFDFLLNQKDVYRNKWDNSDFIMGLSNYDRMDFSPIIAPYSIFPFSEKICADLMFGSILLTVHLNTTLFEKYLLNNGFRINETINSIILKDKKLIGQYLYELEYKSFNFRVPPSLFFKLFFEYINPRTFIKEILYLKNQANKIQTAYAFWHNEKEKEL